MGVQDLRPTGQLRILEIEERIWCNKLAVQPARLDVSIYEQLEASEQGRQAVSHLMTSVLTVTVDVDDITIVRSENLGSIT